jgi:tetratricopeptide (TPR) repeat protein
MLQTFSLGGRRGQRLIPSTVTLMVVMIGLLSSLMGSPMSGLMTGRVWGQSLEELPLERWQKLRETERYQLQIAEKYYREQNWKVAAAEYEKFTNLYEKSDGAAFAQMKWALAQVQLKKHNTAIKEGFQSVIDYWPDSPEAIASRFYLGQTYQAMGQIPKSKSALKELVAKYPDHPASVLAMSQLVAVAQAEKDQTTRLAMLRKLTFDVKRSPAVNTACAQAAGQLASLSFETGAVDEAIRALETTYDAQQVSAQVATLARTVISQQMQEVVGKTKAPKTADATIGWLRGKLPSDLNTDPAKATAREIFYSIADLYAVSGRDAQVLESFEQLTKLLGPSDETWGRLAQFYKSRLKFEDARATYKRYQNANAGLGQVAYSFREQASYDAAIEAYKQLIGRDAEQSASWRSELAQTYRAAKKFMEAVAVYEELIAQDSGKAQQWRWELANTLRDSGKYKEAIGHYRQCDNFPENFKQMAACHRQLKEFNEAILLYNQIVATNPANAPWALLQVGYTREDAGQKEPAIQTFQQVCKRYPKDSHASVAHAHLQNKYKISITLGGAKDE